MSEADEIKTEPATRPAYPKRPPFFVNWYLRNLAFQGYANKIGLPACWLLTCVGLKEDELRYLSPPDFFNSQLAMMCGFGSVHTLISARDKAKEHGLLYYETSVKRQAGVYFLLVPEHWPPVPGAEPVQDSVQQMHRNGKESRTDSAQKREGIAQPSLPIPNPLPDSIPKESPLPPNGGLFDSGKSEKRKPRRQAADEAEVETIYRAYPLHVAKPAAIKAIAKALTKIPFPELLAAVNEYAAAVGSDKTYVPHPATWFNAERWTDDRATWQRTNGHGKGHTKSKVPAGDPINDREAWIEQYLEITYPHGQVPSIDELQQTYNPVTGGIAELRALRRRKAEAEYERIAALKARGQGGQVYDPVWASQHRPNGVRDW